MGWRWILCLPVMWVQAEICLHVAPDGSDVWSGQVARPAISGKDGPLASVEAALIEARRLRAGGAKVSLELAGGRYELARPLIFTAVDSGLAVTARAGERPVLSGGTRLVGWRRSEGDARRWDLPLATGKAGPWHFRQLVVDGRRWQRARQPNSGYFQLTQPLGKASPIELHFRPGDLQPGLVQPGVELVMLMKWTVLHVPLRSTDASRHTAMIPGGPRPYWMDEPDARYWIENAPSALDQAGEWLLDPVTGTVSLLGEAGFDPNQALVVAPRLTTMVEWSGTDAGAGRVKDVRLAGLTFSDTDYEVPADGLICPQAAVSIPGALRANFAADCTVEDGWFTHLGGYAVELRRGCWHWRIVGNEFSDLGAGGIRIGEVNGTDDPAVATHSNEFTDNQLQAMGRVFPPACGVLILRSGTNRIAHNHIHDLYYTGVSVGWEWGYRENPCRANRVEFNHIHEVGQGRLSDMGGIYTLGPQPGTIIRNNLFHDIQSYRYGGWGLYTDEGSTGILFENNIVYRCKDAGFHQHYGRDNVVRNNLLAANENHAVMRTRSEPHRSFWFTNNVIVSSSETLLGSNWEGTSDQFVSEGNVWYDTRLGSDVGRYRFAGNTWAEWQAKGHDRGSRIADPLMVDPERPELGLRAESPAFLQGFRAIDTGSIGPRPKGLRR